ncbi:lysylphosphatidylglycerol synthase domain-containing protein [Kribbella sp. CA-247076]|uniref:lysylphosphatidylglycerol synthase domain-containing protein n=1 Tax=Kribbella sp. CA-247076 TaxID=3239941 RepID=UPI003D8EB2C1
MRRRPSGTSSPGTPRRFVWWAVRVLAVGVVGWLFLVLVRGIDWSAVGFALTHLSGWQYLLLLLLACARLAVLAGPLTLLIAGLPYHRSLMNEAAGAAVATIAPDPSDVVVRLAMFKSWRVETTAATSGLALRTILFYVIRLAAPVLGLAVLWAVHGLDTAFVWFAVLSFLAAAVLLGGLLFALRAASTAAVVGRLIGTVVGRVRPSAGGPEVWTDRLVQFQAHSATTMRRRGAAAGLNLLGYAVVEAIVLVCCMAFVGVRLDLATAVLIGCGFLLVYPMSGLPMMGLGVLDAALITFVTEHTAVESTYLVAGMVVWRVAAQLFPVVAGLLTLAWWRRSDRVTAGS